MASKVAHKKLELTASLREVVGAKVKRLRAEGIIPAVLYGKGMATQNIQVPVKDFDAIFRQAGESTLVFLKVGDTEYPTIIHGVARHPVSGQATHTDFYKVRLDEKITTHVPVVFVGASPAVKDGGIFIRNVNELEVEALPTDLPHEIEVDISKLEKVDDRIVLGDLQMPGVTFLGDATEIIATIQEPKSEEELAAELAEPTTDVSAVEEIKKEKPVEEGEEEGEAPASAPAPEAKK